MDALPLARRSGKQRKEEQRMNPLRRFGRNVPKVVGLCCSASLWWTTSCGSGPATLSTQVGGPPKILLVSPTSGSTTGGTVVDVKGTGFQSGSGVSFGSVAAKSVAFASSSLLLATTPAESAAVVDVTVKNPDGQMSSLPAAFTFSPGTGGPPTTYTSRSDRNRQLESALSPPAVNTVVNDPAFSSRMVRVTDQNTGPP